MKYSISAGHEKTLDTAKNILEVGGNAYDAAIAAYFTSFIAEPCMASAGAGGFANIMTSDKETVTADFFCQTPSNKSIYNLEGLLPIEVDFGSSKEIYYAGAGAMAIPGAIKFIYELHDRYGSIPMKILMEQAQTYAVDGISLNTFQAYDLSLLKEIFKLDESVANVFFKDNKVLKEEGDLIQMPDYALFLDTLKSDGPDFFYKGEIADSIIEFSNNNHGTLSKSDFSNYVVFWDKPLVVPFLNKRVLLPVRSSTGSWILANLLKDFNYKNIDWENEYLSIVNKLIEMPNGLKAYRDRYYRDGASADVYNNAYGGTSHFNIVDQWGNAIALTTTLGEGCGYFIPGTMMQMNNMLGETALQPSGLGTWKPNTRLHSMMTPSIVVNEDGSLNACLGSGGAARIPYMIAQVMMYLYQSGFSLEDAVNAPRVYISKVEKHMERGFRENSNLLRGVNQWEEPSMYFGGVHGIYQDPKGNLNSYGDPRRYGVSITK